MKNIFDEVSDLQFVKNLISKKYSVYAVGGCVRDFFLEKEIKDVDLLITGCSIDSLVTELSKFGTLDLVGKSFGVIKFHCWEKDYGEPFDIALPRKERSTGNLHTDFEVDFDHNTVTLADDLIRRDFTVNSIAWNLNDKSIVDMFNGCQDIKDKHIRTLTEHSFSDDPLRMLRAVQFASRFRFMIGDDTMNQLIANSHLISHISGERIVIELDKICHKGDKKLAVYLLDFSDLYKHIFGSNRPGLSDYINESVLRSDFYFYLMFNGYKESIEFFKTKLKGDDFCFDQMIHIFNIRSYNLIEVDHPWNDINFVELILKTVHKHKELVNSSLVGNEIKTILSFTDQHLLPTQLSELNINGDDLIQLGLKGKQIGSMLKFLFRSCLDLSMRNNREELLSFVEQNKCSTI